MVTMVVRLAISVLLSVLIVPAPALSLNKRGAATIKVTLQQTPPLAKQSSMYLGTDPAKCLLGIPFEGVMSTGVNLDIKYWFVHSDGTKSAVMSMSAPADPGTKFAYNWSKYAAPNQPFSGWVRAEATWSNHPATYKSANVPFTITCIPNKPATWPTAPIIVIPAEGQKVSGGNMVIQPMNPGQSKCSDGGIFTLKMEYRATPTGAWVGLSLMKPMVCGPDGAKKDISGLKPGYYRVIAKEANAKHPFESAWSAWRMFEVLK